jgi:hypothetical protein
MLLLAQAYNQPQATLLPTLKAAEAGADAASLAPRCPLLLLLLLLLSYPPFMPLYRLGPDSK